MHEPVLVPDYTLFIQMGLFFASYFVLNALVFKPYLALLKARREQTVGLREAAEQGRIKAAKLQAEYEAFAIAERKKIAAWSDEQRKKVNEEERQAVAQAREAAAKHSDAGRAQLQAEMGQARQALQGSVREFSSAIVSKMLGRQIDVPAGAPKTSHEAPSAVPT